MNMGTDGQFVEQCLMLRATLPSAICVLESIGKRFAGNYILL